MIKIIFKAISFTVILKSNPVEKLDVDEMADWETYKMVVIEPWELRGEVKQMRMTWPSRCLMECRQTHGDFNAWRQVYILSCLYICVYLCVCMTGTYAPFHRIVLHSVLCTHILSSCVKAPKSMALNIEYKSKPDTTNDGLSVIYIYIQFNYMYKTLILKQNCIHLSYLFSNYLFVLFQFCKTYWNIKCIYGCINLCGWPVLWVKLSAWKKIQFKKKIDQERRKKSKNLWFIDWYNFFFMDLLRFWFQIYIYVYVFFTTIPVQ